MTDSTTKKTEWKQKIIHEMRRFFFCFLFFALFFCSLATYERLLLGAYAMSYLVHYGYGIFEALILSKVILLGEHFKLGERYADRSLLIPTLYKTFLFSILAFLFIILEHFVIGFLHGHDLTKVYHEFINVNIDKALAKLLVMSFVFVLFFAFVETGRALGNDKLLNLFLYRNTKKT